MLKSIANILSKGMCNIAHFSLGRQRQAGKALGAITLVSHSSGHYISVSVWATPLQPNLHVHVNLC